MKITILIFTISFILYKAGYITKLLNALRLDEVPLPQEAPERIVFKSQEIDEGREKWEAEAYYILTKQGYEYPETVKYMGDQMLKNIIREYLDI